MTKKRVFGFMAPILRLLLSTRQRQNDMNSRNTARAT